MPWLAFAWPSGASIVRAVRRLRRQAAVSTTEFEHANRMWHMQRRIEEQGTLKERRKNAWDTSVYPVHPSVGMHSKRLVRLCPWLPDAAPGPLRPPSAQASTR